MKFNFLESIKEYKFFIFYGMFIYLVLCLFVEKIFFAYI
jgi:hypothetical protein